MIRKLLCFFLLGVAVARPLSAQVAEYRGIVRSGDDNQPVAGVLVRVSGGAKGTITDIDGRFSIPNTSGSKDDKLEISYLGYKKQLVKAAQFINVVLQSDNVMLGDVVVVAYGKSSKAALTGSVAQVSSEYIKNHALSSPLEALAGSSAGVQVTTNGGDMDHDGISIQVRGTGSIYGSVSPIIVVDGIVMESSMSYSDINPSDIETISVLKDASATALYGNRASNGVVLITTRQGKSDKLSIEANMKFGTYSRGMSDYSKMDAKQWMESMWQAQKRLYMYNSAYKLSAENAAEKTTNEFVGLLGQNIFDADSKNVFDGDGNLIANIRSGYNDLDWMDEITRTGLRQEYGISANTYTDKYDFFASVGYQNQQGYIKNTDNDRINARVKANFRPKKWFKGGVNISGSVADGSFLNYSDDSFTAYRNPFVTIERMAPIYSYYEHDTDGNVVYENGSPSYNLGKVYLNSRNLVYELYNNKYNMKRTNLAGDAYATVTFLDDFNFTLRGNLVSMRNDKREYQNNGSGEYASSSGSNGGYLIRSFRNFTQKRLIQELNWAHVYNDHHVDAFLAHEAYELKKAFDTSAKGNQMMSVVEDQMSNFIDMTAMTGSEDTYHTESYIMRARYNYADRYFLNTSYRRDGSSRFNKPWGDFWSVGGAWLVSNEEFMKDISSVNSLKLRLSYGETGNDEISGSGNDYYPYQHLYAGTSYAGFGAYTINQFPNYNLTWEKNATFDIALEARLFDRLNLTAEWYHRSSKDLLFPVSYPLSSGMSNNVKGSLTAGLSAINQNIGDVLNTGLELSADVDVIRNRDWKWNVGINATLPSSEVKKLPRHEDIISGNYCFSEGRSLHDFYLTSGQVWIWQTDADYISAPRRWLPTRILRQAML